MNAYVSLSEHVRAGQGRGGPRLVAWQKEGGPRLSGVGVLEPGPLVVLVQTLMLPLMLRQGDAAGTWS